MSNTILVTGSGGLIGSETVRYYIQKGFKVVGIDNDMRSFFFGKEASTLWNINEIQNEFKNAYTHLSIDLRNYAQISEIFKSYNFSLIVHTAAQPSHDWAARDPMLDFEINATVTLALLENFRRFCPTAVFVFTSTNKVYGDTPNSLNFKEFDTRWDLVDSDSFYSGINESMSIDNTTHSIFGVSKSSADLMVQEYGRYFNLNTGIFRGGCLTGPMHSASQMHGFLAFVVKSILTKSKYSIFGYKGKQVRDNLHSFDVVSMIDQFFMNPKQGAVYNIGGGRSNSLSVLEALKMVEDLSGEQAIVEYVDRPRIGDHKWYITDYSKFKKDYPEWKLEFTLDKIINEIITSQKKS